MSNGDAVTAIEKAITCVEAAMRALTGARLSGEHSVTQHGILSVLESVVQRLTALHAEVA